MMQRRQSCDNGGGRENTKGIRIGYEGQELIIKLQFYLKLVSLKKNKVMKKNVSVSFGEEENRISALKNAIRDGINSGIAESFEPKKYLKSLKSKKIIRFIFLSIFVSVFFISYLIKAYICNYDGQEHNKIMSKNIKIVFLHKTIYKYDNQEDGIA